MEALGSAIPNLIRISQLVEICGIAQITHMSMKPRRMKTGNEGSLGLVGHDVVQCKFLECVKMDLTYTSHPDSEFEGESSST